MKKNLHPMWVAFKYICCSKQFLAMRILLFSILSIVNVFASDTYAQNKKLTLNMQDTSIEKVLDEIEKQSEFYFMFNQKLVDVNRKITIDVKDIRIKNILNDIFKETNTEFFVVDRQILLMPKNMSQKMKNTTVLRQDQEQITGIITDSKGDPLPGATIMVVGTNNFAISDFDGTFTLVLDKTEDVTFEVSFIGMKKQTIKWDGNSMLTIIMKTSGELLDEVFVTGYSTISKERATGAFAKINEKELDKSYSPDVVSLLEGKIAGLSTYGGDITIRGINTFRKDRKPLIVIDGLPTEGRWNDDDYNALDDINPNDIASVTVLKDAAAASIYGARAANGVIVIVTKRATTGKTEFNFSYNTAIRPKNKNDHFNSLSVSDYIDYEKNFLETNPEYIADPVAYFDQRDGNNVSYSPVYYEYRQWAKGNLIQTQAMANIDALKSNEAYSKQYNKYALQNELTQQYNLSFRTGTEKSNLVLSLNAFTNKAEQINSKRNRYTFYFQNEQKLKKWFKLGYGVNLVLSENKFADVSLGAGQFSATPYEQIVDASGNRVGRYLMNRPWAESLLNPSRPGLYDMRYNVLDELDMNEKESKYSNIRLFTNMNARLTDWLTYDLSFQYEIVNTKDRAYHSEETYRMREQITRFAEWTPAPLPWLQDAYVYHLPQGGSLKNGNFNQRNYTFSNQLNFNKTFKDAHAVTALAGVEIRENDFNGVRSELYGYDDQSLNSKPVNWATLSRGVRGSLHRTVRRRLSPLDRNSEATNRYFSVYANAAYTYNRKYSVTGSFRIDQTNLFGTDPKFRYRPLWSVGASWLVSDEDFMANASWVSYLKLRASYGVSGSVDQTTSPFLVANFTNDGIVGEQSTIIFRPPNPLLRWEKTTTRNLGIDFGLFNNRLNGSIDTYYKFSDDLLATQKIDPALGFTSGKINNGAMSNRGFEMSLSYNWIKNSSDWSLNTNFIAAHNKNKVERVDLKPTIANDLLSADTNPRNEFYIEGNPISALYAYRYAGLTDTGDPSVYDENGNVVSNVIVDSPDALKFMGQTDPKWSGSFQPTFGYKGFRLSSLFTFYTGHVKRDRVTSLYETLNNRGGNIHGDILNSWTPTNTNTTIPRLSTHDSQNAVGIRSGHWSRADIHVISADELNLRNIVMSYTVPSQVLKKMKLNLVRFNFQVNNPWYTTKKTSNLRSLPKITSYVFGVNVNF